MATDGTIADDTFDNGGAASQPDTDDEYQASICDGSEPSSGSESYCSPRMRLRLKTKSALKLSAKAPASQRKKKPAVQSAMPQKHELQNCSSQKQPMGHDLDLEGYWEGNEASGDITYAAGDLLADSMTSLLM